MKKKFSIVLFIAALLFTMVFNVYAKSGDIAGKIYSTDILAYVNGVAINSYNVGGKTAVVVEDLYDDTAWDYNYGFKWSYDDNERTLTVDSFDVKPFTKQEIKRGNVGKIVGNIYETDIKVIFNSHEVPSYNIGGRTAVCIEDLGTVDESSPNYDAGYSKYMCNFAWDEQNRTVELGGFLERSYRSFTGYPIRKLAFRLEDNKLSCAFDQMNPYVPTLDTKFSDAFKYDTYKIKPVYMEDEIVGNMYMDSNGFPHLQLYYSYLYNKVKNLAVVLSYDEAKKYITDNFKVLDMREDENASVYIAQKDDMKYCLYAFKDGGFLANGAHPSDHTVEFRQSDSEGWCFYVYPFGGPHGTTGMMQSYSTSYFDFNGRYENFLDDDGVDRTEFNKKALTFDKSVLTADGVEYKIDAIGHYFITTPLVNVAQICEVLGIDYRFKNGVFVFNTGGKNHTVSLESSGAATKIDDAAYSMITCDAEIDGVRTEFTYMGGGTLLTNGVYHEKNAYPFLYKGQAYVPFYFFEKLYAQKEINQ